MAHPSPVARFFGYVMITVGILMTLLSGGCTLVGFFISLKTGAYVMINMVLAFGVPFLVTGLGLFFGGLLIAGAGRPKSPPDNAS